MRKVGNTWGQLQKKKKIQDRWKFLNISYKTKIKGSQFLGLEFTIR